MGELVIKTLYDGGQGNVFTVGWMSGYRLRKPHRNECISLAVRESEYGLTATQT